MLVPPDVVTLTSTGPAGPAGAIAIAVVSDTTVKAAGAVPKRTASVVVSPVPVRVTAAPASVGPCVGESAVSAGAAR